MAERKTRKKRTAKTLTPEQRQRRRTIRCLKQLRIRVAVARCAGLAVKLDSAFEYEVIEQSLVALTDLLNAHGALDADRPNLPPDPADG